ncbi:alpha/beta hydrolase [Kineosporia sp. J2-2]|uniref:Alpha/beta hydrolase n=1 Tax=Kineosporia corallincola TaxID=2835133 RepID=A0ABS5TCN6_9ACTN|nr:alpha/beta hydrolase [Kineosporia corallincola]MBT0768179.1 alpha/beta hydrolase [Kineosporia corallincola]
MSDLLLIHGLTYDHRAWGPLRRHLAPGRRVLAVDLPGHGGAPRWESYPLERVLAAIHEQVTAGGLHDPVVVGHSAGAIVATAYAASHPVSAVVDVDQILLPGRFGHLVREAEPVLRGPDWRTFWDRMLAGMGIETMTGEARALVDDATDPRQDLLLGYWDQILTRSDQELEENLRGQLTSIGERGIGYHWLSSYEPPAAHLEWLRSILPVEVTVVGAGHFPHLTDPAGVAALLPG